MVGVADAEGLLHLLDGAVAASKRGDEDLIVGVEWSHRRQLELAFQRNAALGDAPPLDDQVPVSGQLR